MLVVSNGGKFTVPQLDQIDLTDFLTNVLHLNLNTPSGGASHFIINIYFFSIIIYKILK